MTLYDKILQNQKYLETVKKIEATRFITDGKWDWEHGLGHYKRVSQYVNQILLQLQADERTIELGMAAALLHDIGLSKGDKTDHAIESSKLFLEFLDDNDVSEEEKEILRQAILDHSKGKEIKSLVGLSLVLADKLDVTYHRTEHSSIQDALNKEVQKIKKVDIEISDTDLIVNYETDDNFDINIIFPSWPKMVMIPSKVANYLNKNYKFLINHKEFDYQK